MLKPTASALLTEIRAAERLRDSHLSVFKDQIARYSGPSFRGDKPEDQGEWTPENHYYELIALYVPRLVFDNPRVRVTTRRSGSQKDVAEALRHGLNRWVRDTKLRVLLSKLAVDCLFNHGIAMVTEEPRPGYRPGEFQIMPDGSFEGLHWPQVYRLPQRRFFVDPLATSWDEARFFGHVFVRDKDDLLEEARRMPEEGWDAQEIEALAIDEGLDKLHRDKAEGVSRNELVCYEVWVPEYQLEGEDGPDQGYHGTLFTIAVGQHTSSEDGQERAGEIRKPRPFYGPRSGPYYPFGIYYVPDSPYPLSPLVAMEGLVEDLNANARAVSRAAKAYKQMVFVNDADSKLPQQVRDGHDLHVFGTSGLKREDIVPVEVGGPQQRQVEYLALQRERLDRNSGIQEAQRGNVTGAGTATEITIADEAASARMAFIQQQFQDSVEKLLHGVAWYLYHDDRVAFPLGEEAGEELEMEEPWLHGGSHDDESGATFEDLELEIEAYSLERTSEALQQRRAMQMMELVVQIAPIMPTVTWVDWGAFFEKLGDAANVPDLAELFDPAMAAEVGAQMMAQAQMGGGQGGGQGGGGGGQGQAQVQLQRNTTGSPAFGKGPLESGGKKPGGGSSRLKGHQSGANASAKAKSR